MTHFDGITYEPEYDWQRLDKLLGRVWRLMADGRWRNLRTIQQACGGSEASCSARLRDFRKEKFGGWVVHRERVQAKTGGHWIYKLDIPATTRTQYLPFTQ